MSTLELNMYLYLLTPNVHVFVLFSDKPLCMGVTWYLACDFQMFLISPFVVWSMWKFKGSLTGICVLALSCFIPGALTWYYNWPAFETPFISYAA